MHEQVHDENDLMAMLLWQFEMGIDEAILDFPCIDVRSRGLAELPVAGVSSVELETNLNAFLTTNQTENSMVASLSQQTKKTAALERDLVKQTSLADVASLPDLREALASLDDCALKHTASNLCFADGNPGARVMIIGEPPDRDEDRMGIPFVGATGQLLDKMLASIGLDRGSSYLVNLLPWRPPGNRSPTQEEFSILAPWLYRHVQLAKPEVVLLLGGLSAKLVFGRQEGIMKLRGIWHDIDYGDGISCPTLASLHPAYLLRSPAQKRLAFDDFMLLFKRLNNPSKDD